MKPPSLRELGKLLEALAHRATIWTGTSWAFLIALGLTLLWLLSGPIFRLSDTWQLVMNTVSSVVTFLMVFLLQRSQNKDAEAMQLKLNEIVAALQGASNRLINVEDLSEDEVRELHERCRLLSKKATKSGSLTAPHSIEESRPTQCGKGAQK